MSQYPGNVHTDTDESARNSTESERRPLSATVSSRRQQHRYAQILEGEMLFGMDGIRVPSTPLSPGLNFFTQNRPSYWRNSFHYANMEFHDRMNVVDLGIILGRSYGLTYDWMLRDEFHTDFADRMLTEFFPGYDTIAASRTETLREDGFVEWSRDLCVAFSRNVFCLETKILTQEEIIKLLPECFHFVFNNSQVAWQFAKAAREIGAIIIANSVDLTAINYEPAEELRVRGYVFRRINYNGITATEIGIHLATHEFCILFDLPNIGSSLATFRAVIQGLHRRLYMEYVVIISLIVAIIFCAMFFYWTGSMFPFAQAIPNGVNATVQNIPAIGQAPNLPASLANVTNATSSVYYETTIISNALVSEVDHITEISKVYDVVTSITTVTKTLDPVHVTHTIPITYTTTDAYTTTFLTTEITFVSKPIVTLSSSTYYGVTPSHYVSTVTALTVETAPCVCNVTYTDCLEATYNWAHQEAWMVSFLTTWGILIFIVFIFLWRRYCVSRVKIVAHGHQS